MSISSLSQRSTTSSTKDPTPLQPAKANSSKQSLNFPSPGDPNLPELTNSVAAHALTVEKRVVSSRVRVCTKRPRALRVRANLIIRKFIESEPERNNNNLILKTVILVTLTLASLSPLLLLIKK